MSTSRISIKTRRVLLGAITLLITTVWAYNRWRVPADESSDQSTAGFSRSATLQLMAYGLSGPTYIDVISQPGIRLQNQDPVFAKDDSGHWQIVGVVSHRHNNSSTVSKEIASTVVASTVVASTVVASTVTVRWIDNSFWPTNDLPWKFYESPESLTWVAQTLLPESKRKKLTESLAARFQEYRADLMRDLEPLVFQSLRDLEPIIETRLRATLIEKQSDIQELALKYQTELVQQRLVPLIRKEILPIAQRRSEPMMTEIGQEIWERASVWSFAWRYFYDALPLTERELVRKEWRRFLKDEVKPIIELHTDDILRVMRDIAHDVADNSAVRLEIKQAASDLFDDVELRKLMIDSMQSFFENPATMREAVLKNWEGEPGKRFSENLRLMIEPWLREVGAELFGTPEEGLTPEMVSVLRTQILAKDRRWIIVDVCSRRDSQAWNQTSQLSIIHGTELPQYPNLLANPR